MRRWCSLALAFLTGMSGAMRAGEETAAEPRFTQGTHELEALGGYFKSLNSAWFRRPSFQTALVAVRYGWMLTNQRSGIFPGNEELLLEGSVGPILEGPGRVMGGGALLLRHNFACGREPIVVPYFQIGAGLIASDASTDHHQFAIGLPVEFNLQAAIGARWRVSPSWSITTEVDYRHISNAGLSSRNGGYDLGGGLIGLSRMF